MKELKKLDSWEVKMTGTFVNADTAIAKRLCGAADIGTPDTTKVTPRNDLKDADFDDIWLVGDYSDKNGETNGGFIAIKLLNALSTGGFQLKTAKPTAALSLSTCSTRFPQAVSSFRRRTRPRGSLRSSLPATIP